VNDVADTDVLVRATPALWRDLTDGVVVLGPAAQRPRLISGPAARLWTMIEQPVAFGAVVAALAAAHDVTSDIVRADARKVLRALQRDGAVELVP
jgi:hypothetical protein